MLYIQMCTIASHTVLPAAPCSSPRCAHRLPGAREDQCVAGGETMGKHRENDGKPRENGDFTKKILENPRKNGDFTKTNWDFMDFFSC